MTWLRLLSRVAFICNCCFLLALLVQWMPHPPEGELVSMIIILGYVAAVLLNVALHICYAFLLFSPLRLRSIVPPWLIVVNFLFLVPQLILFLK
jgi:hypothetical protein